MSVAFSFSDDVGQKIDDKRFDRAFFRNTRGLFNHSVNPFAKPNVLNEPVQYRNMYPQEGAAPPPNDMEVRCCNQPTTVVIGGRKSEEPPVENASLFWTDLKTPHCCRVAKTTNILGLDTSENS